MTAKPGLGELCCQVSSDPQSFEALYKRFFPKVYNYTYSRLGNRQDAEDVTSRIFERVLGSIDQYDPAKGQISTWIFCVAHRVVIDFYRSKSQNPVKLSSVPSRIISDETPPEIVAINQERDRQVLEALRLLTDRERNVLALKFWGGLTNRHISKVTELSESNVAVIIYRTLRRLRSILEQRGVQIS